MRRFADAALCRPVRLQNDESFVAERFQATFGRTAMPMKSMEINGLMDMSCVARM
jgi:hypothetical protein